MRGLPTGTVTFLFTDIEGSTLLVRELGDGWPALLARHGAIMRAAIEAHGGVEVGTEGDSFFAAFTSVAGAVATAVDAQRALAEEPWPEGGQIRVRMGMHTGEASFSAESYAGLHVHRASRIAGVAHGGQVLLSDATHVLIGGDLPSGTGVRDLGEHRLKDLEHSERIWQLVIDGLTAEFPPLRSLDAIPNNLPARLTSFLGPGGGDRRGGRAARGCADPHADRSRWHREDEPQPRRRGAGHGSLPRRRLPRRARLDHRPRARPADRRDHVEPSRPRRSLEPRADRGPHRGAVDAPRARQLRAGHRRRGRGEPSRGCVPGAHAGREQQDRAAHRRRAGVPGAAAAPARPGPPPAVGAALAVRVGGAVHRSRPGREPVVRGDQRDGAGRRRDLRAPRRAAAGDRACRGADADADPAGDARQARRPPAPSLRRCPRPSRAPADAPGRDRLEPRPAR